MGGDDSVFEFGIEESLVVARDALQAHAGRTLRQWDKVAASYREHKGKLIEALDPATGRKLIPLTLEQGDDDRILAIVNWLEALYRGRNDLMTHHCRITGRKPGCPICLLYSHRVDVSRSIHKGLEPGSALTLYGAKAGQKTTRVVSAVLKTGGCSEKEATALATSLGDMLAIQKPRQGWLVVSVNPLDIIMASECSSYQSCHRLDGQYKGGTMQYLHDDFSLISYYYEKPSEWRGIEVPYKIYRRMVFIRSDKRAGFLGRTYGQAIAGIDKKQVEVLAPLVGGNAENIQMVQQEANLDVRERYYTADSFRKQVAFLDYMEQAFYVTPPAVTPDRFPKLTMQPAPCPKCSQPLPSGTRITCGNCMGEPCSECGKLVAEGHEIAARHPTRGQLSLCPTCAERLLVHCSGCVNQHFQEALTTVEDRGTFHLCPTCLEQYTRECNTCHHRFRLPTVRGGVCRTCRERGEAVG